VTADRAGPAYDRLYREFRWQIPGRYNIATDTIDRHAAARPDALALIAEDESGAISRMTFEDVRRASNRLANVLAGHGLVPGDRLAILLPQVQETGVAHLAAYRAGLIAVPLFVLFGPDAIEYRLADSGAVALITDAANWPKVAEVRQRLPDLRTIIVVDGGGVDGTFDLAAEVATASAVFRTVDTLADDPAIIIYTSGTTGPAKGALHAHRFLLGHLPGVLLPHGFPPEQGDLFWTPADWAWIGMQPRYLEQRRDHADSPGLDGPRGTRPRGRDPRRERGGPGPWGGRRDRDRAAGSGHVPWLLEPTRGDARQVQWRLAPDRRSRQHG